MADLVGPVVEALARPGSEEGVAVDEGAGEEVVLAVVEGSGALQGRAGSLMQERGDLPQEGADVATGVRERGEVPPTDEAEEATLLLRECVEGADVLGPSGQGH